MPTAGLQLGLWLDNSIQSCCHSVMVSKKKKKESLDEVGWMDAQHRCFTAKIGMLHCFYKPGSVPLTMKQKDEEETLQDNIMQSQWYSQNGLLSQRTGQTHMEDLMEAEKQ